MSAHIHIVGNVGGNPDEFNTKKGDVIASLSVAVNRRGRDGEDTTTWYRVKAWGKTAEFVLRNVKKGMRVYAHGEHVVDEWEDKDGKPRVTEEVAFSRVEIVDWKNKDGGDDFGTGAGNVDTNDIPF